MSLLEDFEAYRVYFESLSIGQRFRTQARTVTEADIVNFAGLSGDYNPIHVDAAHAGGTIHGERIAHGLLVLAIASGLCTRLPLMRGMETTLIGLANLQCRWTRPTKIGDTLHVVVEITALEPSSKPDRGSVTMRRTAVNQNGESVMESDWRLMLKRSPVS